MLIYMEIYISVISMRTRFNWEQARSFLARWDWVEDLEDPCYWVRKDQTKILIPAIENLEYRDEYNDFVACLAEIYGLNYHALEASLEAELCQ